MVPLMLIIPLRSRFINAMAVALARPRDVGRQMATGELEVPGVLDWWDREVRAPASG
jgi:hypothetical protein